MTWIWCKKEQENANSLTIRYLSQRKYANDPVSHSNFLLKVYFQAWEFSISLMFKDECIFSLSLTFILLIIQIYWTATRENTLYCEWDGQIYRQFHSLGIWPLTELSVCTSVSCLSDKDAGICSSFITAVLLRRIGRYDFILEVVFLTEYGDMYQLSPVSWDLRQENLLFQDSLS